MILLTIGFFIGALIGFIFAVIIACGKSSEGSTPSPLFTPNYSNQDQPPLPCAPSMDLSLFRKMS